MIIQILFMWWNDNWHFVWESCLNPTRGSHNNQDPWALQPPKPYVGVIDLSMMSGLYYCFVSCLCQNSNSNSIIQIIFVKTNVHPILSLLFFFDFFCSYSQALVWPFWLLPLQPYLSTIIGDRVSPQKRRYPFVYEW